MNTAKRIAKRTEAIAYFSKAILSNIFIQMNTIIIHASEKEAENAVERAEKLIREIERMLKGD